MLCVLLLVGGPPLTAYACSPMLDGEFVDGFVLYGRIVEHVESSFDEQPFHGLRFVPIEEYRVPRRRAEGYLDVYPTGLAPDCSALPVRSNAALARSFPVGAVIGVAGRLPGPDRPLGDIDVHALGILFVVDAACDLDALRRREYDYGRDRRYPQLECGDYRFEANKDIARLDAASAPARVAILERLAGYRGVVDYQDLLRRFVGDETVGRRLLELRYGPVLDASCRNDDAARVPADERLLHLWAEYCTSVDPYDPEAAAARSLYDAIVGGDGGAVRRYLAGGGDPNALLPGTPMGFVHPFKVAVHAKQEGIALDLVEAGARFEQADVDLEAIARSGLSGVMDLVLTQDVERLDRAEYPSAPLQSACSRGDYDIVDVVTRHARPTARMWRDGMPEIVGACLLYGHPDAARLLLRRGAAVDALTLRLAAWGGAAPGMIRELLARGADSAERVPREPGFRGERDDFAAIDLAWEQYRNGDAAVRERLRYSLYELMVAGPPLLNGESLDDVALDGAAELGRFGTWPERLIASARIGFYSAAEEAVAAGVDSATLSRAAIVAVEHGNSDIARMLLDAGASPTGGALHAAARQPNVGLVRLLLRLGADPHERIDGRTALQSAAARVDLDEISYRTTAVDTMFELVHADADPCWLLERTRPDPFPAVVSALVAPECPP